jgi:hypothetical protein
MPLRPTASSTGNVGWTTSDPQATRRRGARARLADSCGDVRDLVYRLVCDEPHPFASRWIPGKHAQTKKSAFHLLRCGIPYAGEIHPQNSRFLSAMSGAPGIPRRMELSASVVSKPQTRGAADRAMAAQSPFEELANTWSAALGVAGACGFVLALLGHGDATVSQ